MIVPGWGQCMKASELKVNRGKYMTRWTTSPAMHYCNKLK